MVSCAHTTWVFAVLYDFHFITVAVDTGTADEIEQLLGATFAIGQ